MVLNRITSSIVYLTVGRNQPANRLFDPILQCVFVLHYILQLFAVVCRPLVVHIMLMGSNDSLLFTFIFRIDLNALAVVP